MNCLDRQPDVPPRSCALRSQPTITPPRTLQAPEHQSTSMHQYCPLTCARLVTPASPNASAALLPLSQPTSRAQSWSTGTLRAAQHSTGQVESQVLRASCSIRDRSGPTQGAAGAQQRGKGG